MQTNACAVFDGGNLAANCDGEVNDRDDFQQSADWPRGFGGNLPKGPERRRKGAQRAGRPGGVITLLTFPGRVPGAGDPQPLSG